MDGGCSTWHDTSTRCTGRPGGAGLREDIAERTDGEGGADWFSGTGGVCG